MRAKPSKKKAIIHAIVKDEVTIAYKAACGVRAGIGDHRRRYVTCKRCINTARAKSR